MGGSKKAGEGYVQIVRQHDESSRSLARSLQHLYKLLSVVCAIAKGAEEQTSVEVTRLVRAASWVHVHLRMRTALFLSTRMYSNVVALCANPGLYPASHTRFAPAATDPCGPLFFAARVPVFAFPFQNTIGGKGNTKISNFPRPAITCVCDPHNRRVSLARHERERSGYKNLMT